jgi:hypothetical protein
VEKDDHADHLHVDLGSESHDSEPHDHDH